MNRSGTKWQNALAATIVLILTGFAIPTSGERGGYPSVDEERYAMLIRDANAQEQVLSEELLKSMPK